MNSPALEMLQASVLGAGPVGTSQTGTTQSSDGVGDFSELLAGVIGEMQTSEDIRGVETADASDDIVEVDDTVVLAQVASLTQQPVESPVVSADIPAAQEDAVAALEVPVTQTVATQETTPENVPDWTAADEAELQQLIGDYVTDGDIAQIGDDKVIIRPFQKVAGDLFAQWAAEGKLDVTVERTQPVEKGLEMSQAGQMVATNLMSSREHPAVESARALFSGREATDGPDFSVRGSAFRFSPEIKTDAKLGLTGLGGDSQLLSSLRTMVSTDAGQGASTSEQQLGEQVGENVMPLSDEEIKSSSEEHRTFAATLHSQGPVHAASDRPAEVITNGPRLAEKVISQIVQDVKVHLKDGSGKVIMRLDPPELGSLKVEIISQAGVVTADLQSANHNVRSLLETHLPALRDALENAGIKVDSFNVSTGANFDQAADHRNENWQQPKHAYHTGHSADNDPVSTMAFASARAAVESAAGYSWLA